MSRPQTDLPVPEIGLIPPPQGHLATLPLRFRWEAVRRHPYYQSFWHSALRFHSNLTNDNARDRVVAQIAACILNMIGVTSSPVHPSTPFAELGECNLHPAWLSGAVRPVSPRGVVPFLLSQLPEADRRFLGELFTESVRAQTDDDRNESDRRGVYQALMNLSTYESHTMDSVANMPFYFLEMQASQRTIIEDVVRLCRHWKAERNQEEKRMRADRFTDYLDVWDLREGWTGSGYVRASETPYREIAARLGKSISSVHNAYRSGFELITGRSFSPDYWRRLFGPIRFSELFTSPSDYFEGCYRRMTSYVSRSPVPESVITPDTGTSRSSFVDQHAQYFDDTASRDILLDIQLLADQGQSNSDIASALEIREEVVNEVLAVLADRNSSSES